ncbi:phage portal protein [Thalassospira lohafexi]|uniref:Phage portal protein n=1 Tax=Thalassospira lohafexi TaxID=744227 RepID=A0A2N3L441_9PROT|nr:phage portal protein [Thalassospira lohafexi]PKR57496.1 phage portal protein [Thalassospira lohafexi]
MKLRKLFGWATRAQTSAQEINTRLWRNEPFLNLGTSQPISHHTVYSCINVIAEGCAMLPFILYRKQEQGRVPAIDHPLYDLMQYSPNPHMTAFQYLQLLFFEKLHYGDHFALKVFDAQGRLSELYPIEYSRVMPFWYLEGETGLRRRAYRVTSFTGQQAIFLEDEIFHIQFKPILSGENYGLRGASVWDQYQNKTIDAANQAENFVSKGFENGVSLSGHVAVDAPLTEEVSKQLRAQIKDAYSGSDKAGTVGVFGSGATFHPHSQTNKDGQILETRKYDRSVIAGILRVSAHLINDLEKATFSNVEHLDLAHYKHCLLPHLIDLEQTGRKDLLTVDERALYELGHDDSLLLRGDQKSFAEVLEKAVQNAQMTPNEARKQRGLPPMSGGDKLFINSASIPIEMAGTNKGPQTDE